ncbi:MAG: FISUMP domain-containing protein, partial [Flavobacteriales bacterium]
PTSLYNAWQQLTAVFTDSVISTYINGVLVAEENVGFPLSWSSEPIILGGTEGTGNNPYPYLGSLDDIGIWNRALTAEEITQLYGNFTQPIAGCTDNSACNFLASATEDDGSCLFEGSPCDDANASTYNDIIDASCGCVGTPIELGVEHTCGAQLVHNPSLTYGSMTDQEGNVYKTIVIGDQEWMAENLNTSIYRNGDAIATGLDDAAWSTTNTGAWAYYNNDANNACPYGKLYNWYTCVDTRELCPTGWRVPSAQEWTLLTDYLGGDTLAGGRMKTVGVLENSTGLWQSPNLEATNSSGFSGIPGGNRNAGGGYSLFGMFGFWWSTSDLGSSTYAVHQDLIYFDGAAGSYNESDNTKTTGLSVRCLRDANTGLIPGCIDLLACNYNPDATEEDGSCLYPGDTCEDLNPLTENDLLDELCECAGTPIVVNCPTLDPALQNGLVGYWPFCGNANDESGNENDGVVNGATLTEDRFGNAGGALDFDGLNDFVVIPPSPTLDIINDFTVSSWFNADSINDIAMQVKMILGRNGIGSGEGDYTFALSNNQFTELNTEGVVSFSATPYLGIGGTEPTTEQGVVAIDSWYHVAVTFDDTNDSLSYFINGVLVDRVFAQMEINSSDDSLFIGCEVDQPGINYKSFFNGTLDDIGIWNRALTAEEVALLYGSFTQTIPGCTDPSAFNYNPQANQNEGCLYAANVFVYNDLNGNGEHESNEPGLANWPVVGNDINGLLWTNGNGNAFVTVPQGAYQFTVLNTTDNWVLTTEASGILSVGSTNCTDQAGNPTPCPNTTLSFGLQVIPGEAIVAAGPFTGFWEILHCTDGYESGVYLENIGSQTVSGFMTLTCDPLFTPNASSYFTTPPVETGPGYALWNIADFLPGEYELLSYFVPGPGVEYLNAVFNFSLELTLLDPQGNIIFDETWNVSPVVACAYDPNDLTGFPETLSHLPSPENEGYTIEHFVREDEMVEFRVRFQNTGTLPAEDIDIYIPIDATVWDLSTIEPLARAADMQVLCLHDGGDIDFSLYDSLEHELPEGVIATDLLIFSFDDIFLPDSASEPDGSQGYVFFQMQAKHGLDVNTELNAQAFIYFEQNPPITTNETYHVIFDCASFTPMVGDIEICDGESLIFDATQPYVDAYEWRLNNVVIGSANTLQYPAEVGTYTLELNTKNVLCPQGENHEVTVIVHEIPELDLPLNATVCEGEELSYEAESNGSVTWSNGANTGDTFTAAQSFTVTATALGEGNCSTSEDWMVTVNPLPSAAVDSANFVLTALDGIAWQWSVNGADNATTQSITATENGNYQVEITNEFGCVAISDVIEVELPTSVFVHSWSTHHLYPNPMTTGARLELPQGIFDVALYDITGACIRTLSKQQGTVVIERESLASGVYQLQVSQGEVVKSVRLVVE